MVCYVIEVTQGPEKYLQRWRWQWRMGVEVNGVLSPLTSLSFQIKISLRTLLLRNSACLMPARWWTRWVLRWLTPTVIKCDLIAFVNVNGWYDRLTVHRARITLYCPYLTKKSPGMPGGHVVMQRLIVPSMMGHNYSLIKYHLSK